MSEQNYAGFWIRVLASLIDTILLLAVISPILMAVYGKEYWLDSAIFSGYWDFVLNYIFPAIVIIIFWVYKSATPGKIVLKLKIADAETNEKPSTGQFIGRYFAYYVSTIPFCLGLIWVGFDKRKQGWHDKLAGTVVIRSL